MGPSDNSLIEDFLRGASFAVVGASRDRTKYGNQVLRAYLAHGRTAYAVNPAAQGVEGLRAYSSVRHLPERVHGVSIITPPQVTDTVIDEIIAAGLTRVWLQPGAEHEGAIERARRNGVAVIAHGPCVLVSLRLLESRS